MARREIESGTPQIKISTDVIFKVPDVFFVEDDDGNKTSIDMGKNFIHYEYEAHLNQPEIIKVVVLDPHQTIFDEHMGKYFRNAISNPPLMMKTQARWVPANSGRRLETTKKIHAITSMHSSAPDSGADQNRITFTGMSLPHYILLAGDAGGYVYSGRISDVITQVCGRYGRDLIKCVVKSNTKDDKHNKWYQNRMDPLSFIKSLLAWSSSLTRRKTRWIYWADTDEIEDSESDKSKSKPKPKLEFFEQRDDESVHRATYWWGADPSRLGHGDIISYKMTGDNSRDTMRGKIVTSGISTLSGAYHDRIVHWKDKDTVYVDDKQTRNKYVQTSRAKESFTLPDTDNPLDEAVGWTRANSLPELSAGEIGMRYSDYIDGYARGQYYKDTTRTEHIIFKILGHHIWSESIGLGYDTIDIMWRTAKLNAHYLHGTWIVDGFKHVVSSKKWHTFLYCHRFYNNASGNVVNRKPKIIDGVDGPIDPETPGLA